MGVKKPFSSHFILQGTHRTHSDDSQWLCYNPADGAQLPPGCLLRSCSCRV